jgi:hypothetical protein
MTVPNKGIAGKFSQKIVLKTFCQRKPILVASIFMNSKRILINYFQVDGSPWLPDAILIEVGKKNILFP